MGKIIQDILKEQNLLPKYTVKEDLANYSHIELTEDEMDVIVLEAKKRKDARLKELERAEKAEAGRKMLQGMDWTLERMKDYASFRADLLFKGEFVWDSYNESVIDLLCAYYADDPRFEQLAVKQKINNPSLKKGIILAGNFGVGKTWLMQIFQKNPKQSFRIYNAKDIADGYRNVREKEKDDYILSYVMPYDNPANDHTMFYQRKCGLCIDDMGTEDVKNDYGNKKNVIGDIVEMRYSQFFMGQMFCATTNLTALQFAEYYGGRVVSRLREQVNFIELGGKDRRK